MIHNLPKTMQVSKNEFATLILFGMVILLASSCSTLERTKYSEPKTIAIKNGSGVYLYMVSLREVPESGGDSVRLGKISPVPIGTTQIITRPSSAPPLPKQVIISWIDSTQRQYDREISLEKVLRNSVVKDKDFLVFEIGFSGRINVYIE